jgi:hypothetical protein
MISKTVTYKDWNGMDRTETFYFHFSQAELMEMEISHEGGFSERVKKIAAANNLPDMLKIWKNFVLDAYGIKSEDGRRFMKNDEIRQSFVECPAYSIIFMELATNTEAASNFINRVVPADMAAQVKN